MDILIWLHRHLQGPVDALKIRPLARRCFRFFLNSGTRKLRSVRQNDRLWRLDPEVALRGEFQELDTVLWLRRVLKPGMQAIDVGANVGQMTLEMAKLVGPSGKVIAIEPAPGNLALLERHIEANGFSDRVQIVAAACTEVAEEVVHLKVFGNHPDAIGSGHTIIFDRPPLESEKKLGSTLIEARGVSIDFLCEDLCLVPDVIKIDVEGAELQVLRGGKHTLGKLNPYLRFAFHPFAFANAKEATNEIRGLLDSLGYDVKNLVDLQLSEYSVQPIRRRIPAKEEASLR